MTEATRRIEPAGTTHDEAFEGLDPLQSPSASSSRSAPVSLLIALVIVVGGTALQLLRIPRVPAWRSLQAEDGGIFLTEALNRPLLSTIGRAYEGYLHVVPRLIAAFASLFPLSSAAVVINTGSSVVVALLALYVYDAGRNVLPSRWGRLVLCGLFLALPATGFEANASINNLHWYLDYACFWVFVARPPTRTRVALGVVVAMGTALSDPLAALLLPLALFRVQQAVRRRDGVRRDAIVAPVVFVVGLALQVVYGVSQKPPRSFVEVDWRDLPGTYGLRVAGSLFVGDAHLLSPFVRYGEVFALGLLAVAVVAAVAAWLASPGRRVIVGVTFAYSVIFLVVPLLIRGTSIYLDRSVPTLDGSRYMIVPSVLLGAGLLIAAFRVPRGAGGWLFARVLLTALLVVVVAGSYRITSSRSGGPDWPDNLRAAQQRCLDRGGDPPGSVGSARSAFATPVGPGQVAIPTAPGQRDFSVWNVVVDCKRVLADAG
ncbi:MAG: hypothetical protein QOC98_2803 [Frankiaceae bacterium]|nr:hypothetical protein [Frankiaceae bacterium]